MPEAPDLEEIKDYFAERVVGPNVESAMVFKPSVLRSLGGDLSSDMPGRSMLTVEWRGQFLSFQPSADRLLVVNPMLTEAVQHCLTKGASVQANLHHHSPLRRLGDALPWTTVG